MVFLFNAGKVNNSSLVSKGVSCLSTQKTGKVFGMIFLSFVIGGVFSSCSKAEEPTISSFNSYLEKTSSPDGGDLVTGLRTASNDILQEKEWELIEDLGSAYGYKLYKKGRAYVQKVNLSMGAQIGSGFGIQSTNPDFPESPFFKRILISSFWRNRPQKALSVINCSFFGYNKKPKDIVDTNFSFPIKINGKLYSVGSYPDADPDPKRILFIGKNDAAIMPFSLETNDRKDVERALRRYPSAICAYSPDKDFGWLSTFRSVGRTMIGIIDQNQDGKKEVLYILTGEFLQSSAKDILISFGCKQEDIIMLDGSDSSQMIMENPVNGNYYSFQEDERTIPNVLYVLRP